MPSKKLDVFDIGVAFGEGVLTGGGNIPKILAKKAVVTTAGEVTKAGVNVTSEKGVQIVGIDKDPLDAGIELVAGGLAGKGSEKILGGMQEGLARDIKAGAFSTLNKAEKQTLRDLNSAAGHQATEKTISAIMDFGMGGTGDHAKGLFQTPDLSTPKDNTMTAPADATGVALPSTDFRPRE